MKTVLHIEPSIFFVEVIKAKFNDSEYEYLSTNSYNEALILLEEFDVDLIISSLEGNGMKCEEFIKNITYSYPDIPICILSGNKLNANMQQFMNLGVIQYIDKEEVNEALIKYIDNIFKGDKYLDMLREREIAVIEDSHFSRLHLKDIFDRYKIKSVRYFESGIELTKSRSEFDIYLIDLVLKDEFGKNIITELREKNEEALIFAVTSLNNPNLLADVIDSGADDIIVKPIEEKVFIAKLKSFIRKLS
ncbi:MAG: response regulator [Clostridium sp.]|nr:response regulator [Clostridium sp.]